MGHGNGLVTPGLWVVLGLHHDVEPLPFFEPLVLRVWQATSISLLRSRSDISVSSRDVYEKQAELGRRFLQVVRVLFPCGLLRCVGSWR